MKKVLTGGNIHCYYCKHCDTQNATCMIDDEYLCNLDGMIDEDEELCIYYEELPII